MKVFLDAEWYKYIKGDLEELSSEDLLEIEDYYNSKYRGLLNEIQADIVVEHSWFTIDYRHQTSVELQEQCELDTLLETMNDLYLNTL